MLKALHAFYYVQNVHKGINIAYDVNVTNIITYDYDGSYQHYSKRAESYDLFQHTHLVLLLERYWTGPTEGQLFQQWTNPKPGFSFRLFFRWVQLQHAVLVNPYIV